MRWRSSPELTGPDERELDMSAGQALLDRLAVRETIEGYLYCLDRKDWGGIAASFSDNARARYNLDPKIMVGGKAIADFLHLVETYASTNHALSNLHIVVEGDHATSDSHVIATLHLGDHLTGRVLVRSIRYQDTLQRDGDRWVISERFHEPQWQFDVTSLPRNLV